MTPTLSDYARREETMPQMRWMRRDVRANAVLQDARTHMPAAALFK